MASAATPQTARKDHCLVEDMLQANGGVYSKGPDWAPYVLTDGALITGQNPASSEQGAHALLQLLG